MAEKAIILTADDALIDKDAPYLAVLPDLMRDLFGARSGSGMQAGFPGFADEPIIRRTHCNGKSFLTIVDTYLSLAAEKSGQRFADGQEMIASLLDIDDRQIDRVSFTEAQEQEALDYMDLSIFNNDRALALRPAKREWLLKERLQTYQHRMDDRIRAYLDENGPLMPGAGEMIQRLGQMDCRIKIIHIGASRNDFKRLEAALLSRTSLKQADVMSSSLRGMEGQDVKDLFSDLEYLAERDIMVFTNHVGLLARSTGLDFSGIDRLQAEFYDKTRRGGAGYSRRKDAPYHVCRIGYNQSATTDYMPSTVRGGQVLKAQSPDDVLKYAGLFLSNALARSFSPASDGRTPSQAGKVVAFMGRKPG